MKTNERIRQIADQYYSNIAINDFSSFIQSDFKNDILIDLSPQRAQENIRQSGLFVCDIQALCAEETLDADNTALVEALLDFAGYIKSSSQFYDYKFNVTHNTCPIQYVIKRLETYPLQKDEIPRYLRLVAQLPATIAGMEDKLRMQRLKGIVLHPEELEISVGMFSSFQQGEGSLLNPRNRGIAISDAADREIRQVIAAFNERIQALIDYMKSSCLPDGEYRGLSATDTGLAYYDSLIYTYTSSHLSPKEIHEIGLRELEVTQEKMRDIIRGLGFQMDIPAFNEHINHDPAFFDSTPQQLESRFRGYLDRIRPRLKDYFHHLPKAGCDIRALAPEEEGSSSWGYYSVPIGTQSKGIFYCNASELHKRNQIRTAAITYHELLPGHHMQTNLAAEDKTLPIIQQRHFNTAFCDGWAEYSSDLAGEMGLYNEYDLYGRYIWDTILCVRLVVDTGMSGLGWSLEKAREFMRKYTLMTEKEIQMESLRYAVDMPGQALAYKMGSLKLHEMRRLAQGSTKDRFNIRDYHDMVLRYGAVPLYLLEKNVQRYINEA